MTIQLNDLELAALLCSRVCHDIISPVGAISNGLEILDEEEDVTMKQMALDLVRRSAQQASAKLQFCRIAFGAAGSPDTFLDLGEAGEVARLFIGAEKIRLEWLLPHCIKPKQEVKMVLNIMLLAVSTIPRGGIVTVEQKAENYLISARGEGAKIPEKSVLILNEQFDPSGFDARLVQVYYTTRLAKQAAFELKTEIVPDKVYFTAHPIESKNTQEVETVLLARTPFLDKNDGHLTKSLS